MNAHRFTVEEFATMMDTHKSTILSLIQQHKVPTVWVEDTELGTIDLFIPDMHTDVAEQIQAYIRKEVGRRHHGTK